MEDPNILRTLLVDLQRNNNTLNTFIVKLKRNLNSNQNPTIREGSTIESTERYVKNVILCDLKVKENIDATAKCNSNGNANNSNI